MNRLQKGLIGKAEAEKQWQAFLTELTVEKVASWDAFQKAKTYYLLLNLENSGFAAPEAVLETVSVKPDFNDTKAYVWWVKAMRYRAVSAK